MGVGAGLSVGHEWPGAIARGGWRIRSGVQETYLGDSLYLAIEITEMVEMTVFGRDCPPPIPPPPLSPGVWWAMSLSLRRGQSRTGSHVCGHPSLGLDES